MKTATQLGWKINVGDKFESPSGDIYEVIGTKPGGKVEMFIREKTVFTDRWTREIKTWKRI